jgi:hypothetical protein
VIDWEATWNSYFQYDFSFVEGFIFNKNFWCDFNLKMETWW